MKTKRSLFPLKVGLVALAVSFVFWRCEVGTTGEPRPNTLPETYISEISPGVTTRVSWYGTDSDGRVESFKYKWDDGSWVATANLSETFPVDDPASPYADFKFADLDDQRTFYVQAIDDRNGADPYPASATVSPNTVKPETQIVEGPQFGETYGPDVKFKWSGVDKDGSIVGFEYTMDDLSNWTYVAAVSEGGEALFLGLGPGAHIFYVRAVDDLGAKDQSPAQTPFIVATGQEPLLESTSPIVDGGGWFAAVSVTLSWAVNVEYYGGQLPTGYATFALDDSTGYSDPTANMQFSWRPALSYNIKGSDIDPGDHTFYVKVRDTQGAVSKFKIGFGAAGFEPTKGILVVNGISPVYEDEITEAYDSSAYWGETDVDFWDLFGTSSSPSISTMPAQTASADDPFYYVGGGGPTTPDILKDYSSVVWVGNAYMGDLEMWALSPIYPYLLAGGNVIITTRNASSFFTGPLTDYLGVSWRAAETATVYPHIAPGLKDLTPFTSHRSGGLSSTEHFSMGSYTNNTALSHYHEDLPFPEGWYHNSDGTSTLLFYNDTDWSYVRGMGAWAHPNLELSANEAPTFPVTGDATTGNFVYIGGRNYGFNRQNAAFDFDYILTNFFGEL